jgi:hypothetical protein
MKIIYHIPAGKDRGLLFGIGCIAVDAAVLPLFPIGQFERMDDLLFHGCDASWVFAPDDTCESFWQFQVFFLGQLAIFDHIHCDVGIDEAQYIQIQCDVFVYFDDVFFPILGALGILDNGHAARQFLQMEQLVDFHTFSCRDMVDDNPCSYTVNIH